MKKGTGVVLLFRKAAHLVRLGFDGDGLNGFQDR